MDHNEKEREKGKKKERKKSLKHSNVITDRGQNYVDNLREPRDYYK